MADDQHAAPSERGGLEIYIHIPFCESKCRYCDFASFAGRDADMEAYAKRVCEEISACSARGQEVKTAYIGGGTPSRMPGPMLASILNTAQSVFRFSRDAEITCEANPGTMSAAWLDAMRACGVNRISMGAQSASERLLRTLGRIHTWPQVEQSVRMARQAGFDRLNLDLMLGLPGQTEVDVRDTLSAALSLDPGHLSVYGLIVEPGTPLAEVYARGEVTLPEDEQERTAYWLAVNMLARFGYAQYEISNFAKPGQACRHNIGYWTRAPYIGFGLAAHSLLGGVRYSNPASFESYMQGEPGDKEVLTKKDAMFETLMLGLRMNAGVSASEFLNMYGVSLPDYLAGREVPLIARGLLDWDDDTLRLTQNGMDIQNTVLVELME